MSRLDLCCTYVASPSSSALVLLTLRPDGRRAAPAINRKHEVHRELFKLRMVKETVMHNCINKLLITQSDMALESLCCLLSIIGNILDFDEMEEILNRRKVSSQVSFLLQDIVDLRKNYWFPIKSEQGYRPICQLSMEAKMENMQEMIEKQQQLVPKLGCLSSSTLNLLPALLLSSPFTCSLNMLFDRTNWIQDSAEVFNQVNLAESLGCSSDYSKLEVLGPETHALLTLPALPTPANLLGP
ncbi:hypothetical protein SKAU_G00097650 [Synaphobranchus kaupii]|uniref:Uncharacterized protein n=1 Tax=Synaphobranchus kaupii TaxID=118154 RepID=A0A9Q1J624_SYNKA|nr:hypothetical protein SKAU_G00097650 [Synaphobranchus kaupii]